MSTRCPRDEEDLGVCSVHSLHSSGPFINFSVLVLQEISLHP